MISKEKLLNGYVKTSNRELVRLFLSECLKYEEINLPYISDNVFIDWKYFALTGRGTPCGHNYGAVTKKEELTLEDFKPKPKTKVTYELVTDMTSNEVAKAMIDGEVFYDKYGIDCYQWNCSRFINNKGFCASCDGDFYRKVEEINWKDAVIDWHKNLNDVYEPSVRMNGSVAKVLNDVRWKNISTDEFIKLCHLISELTDKPE